MSGSRTAAPLSDLATVFQQLFLGSSKSQDESGKKSETGAVTEAGSTAGTSTSSTTTSAELIAKLNTLFDNALGNAQNPTAVKPVVDNIIRQAQVAFAPTLAREAGSGLYNSSSKTALANQAAADASGAASSAVLNYITGQQGIATNVGNILSNSQRTTTNNQTATTSAAKTSTGNATTAATTTAKAAPAVSSGFSTLAGAGLLGYSAYKNRDKLTKLFGIDDLISGGGGDALNLGDDVLRTISGVDLPEALAGGFYNDVIAPFDWLGGGVVDDPLATVEGGADGISEILGDVLPTGEDFSQFLSDFDIGSLFADGTFGDITEVLDIGDGVTDLFGGLGDFAGEILDTIWSIF